jgi:histone H3/H4
MLVVAAKTKKMIKDKGMNTSQAALGELSKHIESVVQAAIGVAQADGRKTVMDRDIIQIVKLDNRVLTTSST